MFFGEHPFWRERVAALGTGPPALPGRAWSADRLAEVVAATDDLSIRRRAVELGEVIRREDGETAAAKFTEEAVTERVPRSVLSENVSH
ncbi:MAG: hypothetical protein K2Y56_09510 [Methylobacterium sp.]|uniref:hypothetical protein n=1 Tax=Methylobacterium sp. TaxID=409 RepID=UPI0025CC7711|nr:hypothetical protein [Methylobacterium sp.]MBX9931757.1 hypothetical protein [Methylobacterium sp.]